MRISFDVDDTLVCGPGVPTEQHLPRWWRWRYGEPIRFGTKELSSELIARGHEVWIYTTSLRSPGYLRGWFRAFGVELSGVVNQAHHDRRNGRRGPSKFPPAFGIDLHVDDSEGVAEEGRRHGFDVVVVSPNDLEWTARVLEAVELRSVRTPHSGAAAPRITESRR